ncbi:hypothetical protein TWF730_004281 [Orbilia blumenaviensis]|uniref:Virulence factor Evf domain-containing protein n=1 Tax=Orbilia blumenaviensis TaxID=1796055 RepID=A0AAV9U1F4_9PEZI
MFTERDVPPPQTDKGLHRDSTQLLGGMLHHLHSSREEKLSNPLFPKFVEAHTMLAAAAVQPAANDNPSVPQTKDRFSQVASLLASATKGPQAQVDQGSAPLPITVTIKDSGTPDSGPIPMGAETTRTLRPDYTEAGIVPNFEYLQGITSMINLWTTLNSMIIRQQRGHPDPYDITDPLQAGQAYADIANSAYQAFTGPMAGVLSLSAAKTSLYQRDFNSFSFHLGFLGDLFSDLSLDDDAKKSLDKLLTNLANAIGTIQVEETSERNYVAQVFITQDTQRKELTPDYKDKHAIYLPRIKLTYLEIDAKSFRAATKKFWGGETPEENFTFTAKRTEVNATLNVDRYLQQRDHYSEIMQLVTGHNSEDWGRMCSSPITRRKI